MITLRSITVAILLTTFMYFGAVIKTTNTRGGGMKQRHAPGEGEGERERKLKTSVEAAKAAGIEFQTGHIVGGSAAVGSEVPWFVHFGDGICGGSLISGDRVLTAAHCVAGGTPASVRVGATSQSNGIPVNVRCANTHPNYDGFVGNDLAVLKLTNAVEVESIKLNPNSGNPASGDSLTVIGLGRTSTGGPVSSELLKLTQTYVEPSTCDSNYGGGGVIDSNEVLCALSSSGSGACNGDSGGPLFDSTNHQVGIVSFGSSAGCASGVPDGYTRVSNYGEWIVNQIFSDGCDCNWSPFVFGFTAVRDAVVRYSQSFFRGEDSV